MKRSMMQTLAAFIGMAAMFEPGFDNRRGFAQETERTPKSAATNKHGQMKFNIDGVEVWAINLKNAKRKAQNIKAKCQ